VLSKSVTANYTCRTGANGLFADPSSCSIYHWCVLGVLHSTHFCNPGLHFSASASGCVWPKDAECKEIYICIRAPNVKRMKWIDPFGALIYICIFMYLFYLRRRTNCTTLFIN
jgi:hypothetical protein